MSSYNSQPVEGVFIPEPGNRDSTPSSLESAGTTAGESTERSSTESVATARSRSKKRINVVVQDQFNVLSGSFDIGGEFACSHCQGYRVQWSTWNATKAREHLMICRGTAGEIKSLVSGTSQASRKSKMSRMSMSTSNTGSLASESAADIHRASSSASRVLQSSYSGSKKILAKAIEVPWKRTTMNEKTADEILTAQVEASLARFEPPARICDPFVKNALATSSGSGILAHIPHPNTVFDRFVPKIDRAVHSHMIETLNRTPGNIGISFDGVTVLGKSHVLYTCSKGEQSMFVHLAQLGSDVHVPLAEIEDAAKQLMKAKKEIGGAICNAAIDNAAIGVADGVIKKYAELFPEEPPILRTRDPAHCIDLVAKDSAEVTCFANLLKVAKSIIKFLNTDRVGGIVAELVKNKRCIPVPHAALLSETRFYGAADMFEGVLKNKPVLDIIQSTEAFENYYSSRTSTQNIDDVLATLIPNLYRQLKVATSWFAVLKNANKMCSSESFPMSAYLPLVQATRNGLTKSLNNEGGQPFDVIFGTGSRNQLALFVRGRFNMDGVPPAGRKVGLLDTYQIWAHLVDPYARYLQPAVAIQGGVMPGESISFHIHQMIQFFSHGINCTSSIRQDMYQEFLQMRNQEGSYMYRYMDKAPETLNFDEQVGEQKKLTLSIVEAWVNIHHRHNGRLRFFAGFPPTSFYDRLAKPLLSIKATGSICVERAAKPLKNKVATKERNRLGTDKRDMLLRVGINMHLKTTTLKSVKASIGEIEDDYDLIYD
jgi:hypothetical protein